MAKLRTSATVADLAGSLGGVTVQRGRYGLVLGQRMARPGGATSAQDDTRREFARIRKEFLGLSKAARAAWRSYVFERLYHDSLGVARHPSDWGAFYQTQLQLHRAGVESGSDLFRDG